MINTFLDKSWIAAVFATLAASLCCISPLIALLGGISGIASFSWIDPIRPYLIGFSVLVLTLAWYYSLRRKSDTLSECECEVKSGLFLQSQKFLLVVTLVSGLLITFPYYSASLYGAPKQSSGISLQQGNLKWVEMTVNGMSCADCSKHIDGTLSKVPGVIKVSTSFDKAQTTVSYDPDKTSADSLKNRINQIGYKVTAIKSQSK